MYIPSVFNEKAHRNPLYENPSLYKEALDRDLLNKVKFIARSLSNGVVEPEKKGPEFEDLQPQSREHVNSLRLVTSKAP